MYNIHETLHIFQTFIIFVIDMKPNIPASLYVRILCVLGFIISMYAVYVEHMTSRQSSEDSTSSGTDEKLFPTSEFKALCDIESIGASCSAVFQLPEGRLLSYMNIVPHGSVLDVPNAALGVIYYFTIFSLESFVAKTTFIQQITVAINATALISSIILAIKLLELREFCIVCLTAHVLNTLLIVFYVKRLLKTRGGKQKTV
jgi:uncharacterized membrane protein